MRWNYSLRNPNRNQIAAIGGELEYSGVVECFSTISDTHVVILLSLIKKDEAPNILKEK